MKNIINLMLCILIFTTACNKNSNTGSDNHSFQIGIAVINSHPALLEIERGIKDELKAQNINAFIDSQNANNDANIINAIAAKFASDKKDLSIGIATPSAVALANAIKDKPVLFATVNDPIGAGLVDSLDKGKGNVTGLSDAIPIKEHLKIFHSIYPFKKLGFIYSSAEKNSVTMYNQTKDACKEMGIALLPVTIYNPSEVNMAAASLSGKVDAFYVVTDNTLVSGITALISAAKAAKTPIFSEDYISAENGGILYAIGFDYYKAGRKTGKMAAEILKGKKPADMPVTFMDYPEESLMVVDMDRAKALNIEIPENLITKNTKIIENKK
ncbi:MAG: ABC transporter substrate-binding protein [Candidatus Mucispirillum faecigallinarum]|nr:ABC transporter substrate-binding protein [Candidatus Mucispirillum faecigallinarum]